MISANSSIDTDYFLYEMSSAELDVLLDQINAAYKNSWEQTRKIATAFGGELSFPWDNEKTEKTLTQNELQENFKTFFQHSETAI